MTYIPPTSHMTLLATVRRERLLPVPGEVLATAGQRVETGDVVASAEVQQAHRLVDAARALGVPRAQVAKYLKKAEGEAVKRNEVVAARQSWLGLGARTVTAPVDGRLVFCDNGQALFAATSTIELRAGLPGTVLSVVPSRGLLIETVGALLEGLWGNGREDFSVLRLLSPAPDTALTQAMLEPNLREAIVAIGRLADAAPLKALKELGVRGLILGTAPVDQLPALQALAFPVVVVDGFSERGFSGSALTLLSGNAGRQVWLNAQPANPLTGARPEAIIPLPAGQTPPPPLEGEPLQEGKRVRVLRGPEAGAVGTLLGLSPRPMPLANGLRAPVAAVALNETQEGVRPTVTVPFANLELLE